MKKIVNILIVLCILLSMSGCSKTDEEKAETYLKNNEYKKAYDLLYDLDEYHTRADDCVVEWYKYCLENGSIDSELDNIKINKYYDVYNVILNYLSNKITVTKDEARLVLSVMDKISDKLVDDESNKFSAVKKSLEYKIDDKYIFDFKQHNSDTYDNYYSSVHNYSDDNLNNIGAGFRTYSDKIGVGVEKFYYDGTPSEIQYLMYGDFSDYEWAPNSINSGYIYVSNGRSQTLSISSRANFDGYWFYYFTTDEQGNNNGLYRINTNNEIETILSQEEINGNDILTAFVVDNDILYTFTETENTKTIYRIYLPEMKKDTYEINVPQGLHFTLLVPNDSDHIKYQTYGEDCLKKYVELRNDKDAMYDLLKKYIPVDKDKFYSQFDAMFEEVPSNDYFNSILYALNNEYGRDFVKQYVYNYDIKTGETTQTEASELPINNYK